MVHCTRCGHLADLEGHFEDLASDAGLTERQLEVALLVLRGNSNRDIAQHLGCSPGNVKGILRSVYAKLHVDNARQLFSLLLPVRPPFEKLRSMRWLL